MDSVLCQPHHADLCGVLHGDDMVKKRIYYVDASFRWAMVFVRACMNLRRNSDVLTPEQLEVLRDIRMLSWVQIKIHMRKIVTPNWDETASWDNA